MKNQQQQQQDNNNEKKEQQHQQQQQTGVVVQPIEIKIINKYNFILYCYWINNDNNKEEIFLDKITSNSIQLFNAYHGHEFIIKDGNNVVYKQFFVNDDDDGSGEEVKQLVIEFV